MVQFLTRFITYWNAEHFWKLNFTVLLFDLSRYPFSMSTTPSLPQKRLPSTCCCMQHLIELVYSYWSDPVFSKKLFKYSVFESSPDAMQIVTATGWKTRNQISFIVVFIVFCAILVLWTKKKASPDTKRDSSIDAT